MLYETSNCPRCGSPIFDVEGIRVTSCTCGKVQSSAPATQTNPWNAPAANSYDSYQLLKDIVSQECLDENGNLDSFNKVYFAKAIELLHIRGDVKITAKKGPRVQAEWL